MGMGCGHSDHQACREKSMILVFGVVLFACIGLGYIWTGHVTDGQYIRASAGVVSTAALTILLMVRFLL